MALPFGITTTFDPKRVEEMLRRCDDLRPYYRHAANIIRRSWAENFRRGGRPAWKPLKPSTVYSKAANGVEQGFPYATMRGRQRVRRLEQAGRRSLANILIARGDLRDSYATKSRHHLERISKAGLVIGSKHPLARFHEYGTNPYTIRPRRAKALRFVGSQGSQVFRGVVRHPGLPARPVTPLQPEDVQELRESLYRYIETGRAER